MCVGLYDFIQLEFNTEFHMFVAIYQTQLFYLFLSIILYILFATIRFEWFTSSLRPLPAPL